MSKAQELRGRLNEPERDQLAQETAEYIANTLIPSLGLDDAGGVTLVGPTAPRDVEEIKATLLRGHYWLSWLDDRVAGALAQLNVERDEGDPE
jgi:hypothetical protein